MATLFARACGLLGLRFGAQPIVVACSGGADSAATLLLARAVFPQAPLIACYVDHGIRPQRSIARDVAAVRAQARAAGAQALVKRVARTLRRSVQPDRGSPEERARNARYRALVQTAERARAAVVLTGHQRDDLVETSILALARGSGIDGVAAMRPTRRLSERVTLARPLLWATKAQCSAYVLSHGLPFSHDETNDDPSIPRNAVRMLVSQLEMSVPQASRSIARSAALLADDRALLEGMSAQALVQARTEAGDFSSGMLRKLPRALLRRVVRAAVAATKSARDFSFTHCDAIARAIKLGRGGRYHAGNATVVLSSGKLVVEARDKKSGPRSARVAIDLSRLPATYKTPFGTADLRTSASQGRGRRTSLDLDLERLRSAGELELRTPRAGDVCVPSGRRHAVSLARFLAKAGVPATRRSQACLLCAGGRIAAVLGLRVMDQFQPVARKPVLTVAWQAADI